MTTGRVFQTSYSPQSAARYLWIPLIIASVSGFKRLVSQCCYTHRCVGRFHRYRTSQLALFKTLPGGASIDRQGRLISMVWDICPGLRSDAPAYLRVPGLSISPRIMRLDLNAPIDQAVQPKQSFLRPSWQRTLGRGQRLFTCCIFTKRAAGSIRRHHQRLRTIPGYTHHSHAAEGQQ